MKKSVFIISAIFMMMVIVTQLVYNSNLKNKLKEEKLNLAELEKENPHLMPENIKQNENTHYQYFTIEEIIMDDLVKFGLKYIDLSNLSSISTLNTVSPNNAEWMTDSHGKSDFVKGKVYCGLIKLIEGEDEQSHWFPITQIKEIEFYNTFQKYKHLLFYNLSRKEYDAKYRLCIENLIAIYDHMQSVEGNENKFEEFKENNNVLIKPPMYHETLMNSREYSESYQFFLHTFWGRRFTTGNTTETYNILKEIQKFYAK